MSENAKSFFFYIQLLATFWQPFEKENEKGMSYDTP